VLHKIFKDLAVLSCKPLIIATILMIHVCWVHLISFVLIAERFIDGFKFSCSDFEYSIHWRWASYLSSGEITVKNSMKMKRKQFFLKRKTHPCMTEMLKFLLFRCYGRLSRLKLMVVAPQRWLLLHLMELQFLHQGGKILQLCRILFIKNMILLNVFLFC